MKKWLSYPLILLVLCCMSSCGHRARLIPRSVMPRIIADMLLADEWIRSRPDLRHCADTCLFFESVFNRYGYTSADYKKSMGEYVQDPERLAKIYRRTVEILTEERSVAELYARSVADAGEAGGTCDGGYVPKDFSDRGSVWDTTLWDGRPDSLVWVKL